MSLEKFDRLKKGWTKEEKMEFLIDLMGTEEDIFHPIKNADKKQAVVIKKENEDGSKPSNP